MTVYTTYRQTVLYLATVLSLSFGNVLAEAQDNWNVLVDSQFDKGAKLNCWETGTSRGTTAVKNGTLQIASRSGDKAAWASNYVTYTGDFSLSEATVKMNIDVVSQNLQRDFLIILTPKEKHFRREPAVWITIGHESDGSTVLVRQYKQDRRQRQLVKKKLPLRLDGPFNVSLTLTNGSGVLKITRGEKHRIINLPRLFDKTWMIYPFTVLVGTAQNGDAGRPAEVRISRIQILTTRDDEVSAGETVGNSPGKSQEVRYLYLDTVANRHFKDKTPSDSEGGWTDQGANDLRFIPRGYQYFRNVPFHIVDKLEEIGNEYRPGCVLLKSTNTPDMPLESEPISVDGKAPYLYFLQTAAWAEPGLHCADYIIQYDDGSMETIPMRVGSEVGDWWNPKDMPNAVVAWDGVNSMSFHVGFYLYEWKNPHPGKTIKTIVFKSRNTVTVPVLIAITASDKAIPIGAKARRFRKQAHRICEYRQRPKTSLYWEKGPADLTVQRRLPIAKTSDVKQARIDVIRYRAETPTTVSCTIDGVTMKKKLREGELKARFFITDEKRLKSLTEKKDNFDIHVTLSGDNGIGTMVYESNPNEMFIPGGEDVADKTYAITGVFQVTGFLPVHRLSGYVEFKPNPMGKPKPAETVEEKLHLAKTHPDLLGGELCLNGMWQWQPGPVGYDAKINPIPAKGWRDIAVPANVDYDLADGVDPQCISAWFKKDLYCPKPWAGKRVVLHFEMVADFATVFCNGKKLAEHVGIHPFDVDLTDYIQWGSTNTIQLFCQNVYKGIVPREEKECFSDLFHRVKKYKGRAYRYDCGPGASDQKPDEVRLYMDGKDIARKSSLKDVVSKGDGRYFRRKEDGVLYFSTPGNVPLEKIWDRFVLGTTRAGATRHYTRGAKPKCFIRHYPRDCGPMRDVSLRIRSKARVSEVFVKPSVRKMKLDVDVSLQNVPADGAILLARVRDGASTVLSFDSETIENKTKTITLSKSWNNPILWGPSNPFLYSLELELKDPKTGKTLDRRFVRFGFREFWIEGPYFVFNGYKPFYIQGHSIGAWQMPFHRHHLRWYYADANQQANMNMVRFHKGGINFPEVLDVADEMGMLVVQETNLGDLRGGYDPFDPAKPEETTPPLLDWFVQQSKPQRNHPSLVIWGTENECCLMRQGAKLTQNQRNGTEMVLRLNAAFQKMDPTRPTMNNGGHIFVYTDMFKDPRLDIVDGHYVNPRVWDGWKRKYGKPCSMGEISLGGPFGWTYQGEVRNRRKRGENPQPYFYDAVNGATEYLKGRLRTFRAQDLASLWPFGAMKTYHPFLLLWDGIDYYGATPPIPWPAMSGPEYKRDHLSYGRGNYNFYDPGTAHCAYLRTYDPMKDEFREVTKLEPRFSPEAVVQVLDKDDKPMPNIAVWLTPSDQPTNAVGSMTDDEGKAWFVCKGGPGTYTAWIRHEGRWRHATVTPAPVGEWMQVKTIQVKCSE